ncbi:MAG TPA: hypothetical protein VFQ91_27080 [Bryobacteraceae bacterium]|nr:hypothetical protein [Bryobacteraceae bacterium]
MLSPTRAEIAIVLALLLLFVGVALFSPLHKHTLGKADSCTFNNLEHQMVSLAEAAVVLAPIVFQLESAPAPTVADPFTAQRLSSRGRAPPVLS